MSLVVVLQIGTCIAAAFLAVFWIHYWRQLLVDEYRQNLFDVRQELFDAAWNEKISFSDPSYHALRYMLHGLIRYAHRLSVPTLILMVLFKGRLFGIERVEEYVDPRLKEAEQRHPEIFEAVMSQAGRHTAHFLFQASLLLRVTLLIAAAVAHASRRLEEYVGTRLRPLLDEVGTVGRRDARLSR